MQRSDTRRRKRQLSEETLRETPMVYDPYKETFRGSQKDYDEWYERSIEFAKSQLTSVLIFRRRGSEPAIGSGLIVLYKEQHYLITAGHVVAALAEYGHDGRLQIGRDRYTVKDGLSRIETRRTPDFAVMRLGAEEVRNTRCNVFPMPLECPTPRQGTLCVVVGNIGATKSPVPPYGMAIGQMNIFARIDTVELDQFSFRLDADRYDSQPNVDDNGGELDDNGGLSGAGIFVATDPPQLMGFVYEGIAWNSREHKIFGLPAQLLHDLHLFDAADVLYSNHPCSAPPDLMMEKLLHPLPRIVRLRYGGPAFEVHTLFEAIQLLETLRSDSPANLTWALVKAAFQPDESMNAEEIAVARDAFDNALRRGELLDDCENALSRAVESRNPEDMAMATLALEDLLRSRGWLDE